MRKLLYGLAALTLILLLYAANSLSPFGRPVKYVAYLGFNYLNVAKDSANYYADSLRIVSLQVYLDRINGRQDRASYPVEYRLRTFQCDYQEDTIWQLYRRMAADSLR